jgi:hypothetical protein
MARNMLKVVGLSEKKEKLPREITPPEASMLSLHSLPSVQAEDEVSVMIKVWAISARETSHAADHRRTVQHG